MKRFALWPRSSGKHLGEFSGNRLLPKRVGTGGRIQYREGTWDRFKLQDKQKTSIIVAPLLTLSLPRSKRTFSQPFVEKTYKWYYENLVIQSFFVWLSYEKPSSSYWVMSCYWWGYRRNLNLITLCSQLRSNCSDAAFVPRSNRVLPKDPKRVCGIDSDPASHSFW